MQTNKALYFPDTNIDITKVLQELFFFEHIFFYQAAENNEPAAGAGHEELCSGYPPLPLGPELDRFNRLITELKGHEQEFYNGQLSGMALGNLESRDEKTVKEIISSVAGSNDQERESDDQNALWHYRLLLKLAEIKRREEEELDKELAEIADKEASLYDYLKGDPEIDKLLAAAAPAKASGVAELTDTVLKAWGHLFLHDRRNSHRLLLTADKDAAESLFEAHNALSGGRLPLRICRLTLPLLGEQEEEAWLSRRGEFRAKARKMLAGFSDLFLEVTEKGRNEDTLQKSTVLAAEWGSLVEEFSPSDPQSGAHSCGPQHTNPPHLEIYLCEYSLAELVARHCRLSRISGDRGAGFGLIALKTSRPITCTD